ncbi:MAG: Na+/H+ antiporter subunit E [Alphaproteobacteria bacterium]|nr:Na+/H+ antiporter subunit E [Alphaproteobacteria bacterium]
MRYVSLGLILFGFWLLLSGHYTTFLVMAGFMSAFLVVCFASYMQVVDREGFPIELYRGLLTYWPWLIVEIFKSALSVTKIILDPSLPISPNVFSLRSSQKTALGINVFANSVTLTPGTIAIRLDVNNVVVHALTKEGVADLKRGEMDARVTRLERGK